MQIWRITRADRAELRDRVARPGRVARSRIQLSTDSFLKIFRIRNIYRNYKIVKWLVLKTIIIGCLTKIPGVSDDWTTEKIDHCYIFTSAAFVFNHFNESPHILAKSRGLTSLDIVQLGPVRHSDPPYLHLVYFEAIIL